MSKRSLIFFVVFMISILGISLYFYFNTLHLSKELQSTQDVLAKYQQEMIKASEECEQAAQTNEECEVEIVDYSKLPETVILNVEIYAQKYPASCEIASAHIAMKYFGVDKSEDEILEVVGIDPTKLEKQEDGRWHWGNPQMNYIGSLYLPGAVYNAPVYRALSEFGFSRSISKTNWEIEELYSYIKRGFPVIAWISSDFKIQPKTPTFADDGTENIWIPHQHALIIRGVDADKVYIMDVWKGTYYSVSHEQFKIGFANLNNMAIAVIPD